MIGFNRIRHLIINTRIIENLDIYFKLSLNNHFDEEHFLVICDLDNPQFYLPKLCQQENIRRIYFHSSLDNFEEYQTIIKSFSKLISILQYSDTLVHMILHDFIYYLIKLAENYQKQNKIKLAKIRYEYALQLQSSLQKFLKERIQLLKNH
jgi:tetratricopeptide (TPR) repeat protein